MEIPNSLLPSRLAVASGFAHGEYFIAAAPGTTVEHVVDPDYWLHLASRLKVYDRIEVVAQDGAFDIDVRVVATDPRGHYVVVRPLRVWVPDEQDARKPSLRQMQAADGDGFIVEEDPVHGWRVMRGGDIIARRLKDKATAEAVRADARAGKPYKQAG